MKMYRAVPIAGFDSAKQFSAPTTRRTPSNVPYLVDNVWDALRPDHAPSRRFAAYASPTPELALVNASAAGSDPSLYVACEIVFKGTDIVLAHLKETDARFHPDIGRFVRKVAEVQGANFGSMSLELKAAHAALYLPGVSKFELFAYFCSTSQAQDLRRQLQDLSTFWKDASYEPQPHNGELFFELRNGTTYTLQPV
jgi:hypothetical protein